MVAGACDTRVLQTGDCAAAVSAALDASVAARREAARDVALGDVGVDVALGNAGVIADVFRQTVGRVGATLAGAADKQKKPRTQACGQGEVPRDFYAVCMSAFIF